MDDVRTEIMMDILTLEGNSASPPSFVQELMRQYTFGDT
jgi:hypothetical protein